MRTLISMLMVSSLMVGYQAPPDEADPPDVNVRGGGEGRTRHLDISTDTIKISGSKGGEGDGYRIKRPCWYEPAGNAEEMFRKISDPRGNRTQADTDRFREFIQPFKDKLGQEGLWWVPAYNKADPNGAACWAGLELFVFAPPNTTPPSGITLEQLAEVARAALTVPKPTIKLNPDAKSYVNLPTWVWLDGIGEPTRTVTASIPGVMSVTLVATLKEIKIDPGTSQDRAEVTESGCGAAGRPFTKSGTFSCGVRYLHSSIDQPGEKYTLTVSTVWPVEVADNTVPVQFAPVEVSATRDVPVGEIQSNVTPPAN
ncbi:hypothetical protein ABZW11_00935 [Nonomuraea sp. NPDC004580]|uniref:hypothetical protein n=1 Tax=Nonomuraea sp. NPDC004580 TaxID=3154552 RepID=UPI0033BD1833